MTTVWCPAQVTPLFHYNIFYYKIISMWFCDITISHSSIPYSILGEVFKLKLWIITHIFLPWNMVVIPHHTQAGATSAGPCIWYLSSTYSIFHPFLYLAACMSIFSSTGKPFLNQLYSWYLCLGLLTPESNKGPATQWKLNRYWTEMNHQKGMLHNVLVNDKKNGFLYTCKG